MRYALTPPFSALRLRQHRLSVVSILPTQLSGNVYVSSETYVAPGRYSQRRTPFRLNVWNSNPRSSPLEVLVTCTREPSTVRRSVSNAPGCLSRMFKRRLRCILTLLFSLPALTHQTQDFCKEAVTWKYLDHPNILPLLGITTDPLQLVSKWVSGGNLREYIKKRPDPDRHRLVGILFVLTVRRVTLLPAVRHHRRTLLPSLLQCDTW